MTIRNLTICFGGAGNLASITEVRDLSWPEFAKLLTTDPVVTEDKAARGWYIPAAFSPKYRDSGNFVARHALTLDYDHIAKEDVATIQAAFKGYAYCIYTTASHTTEKPRVRVVMPTDRPMGFDEFCAVSRKVASWAGIELASRESHAAAQMMFLPTVKPDGEFRGKVESGQWLDVDAVLGFYENWADRTEWPTRKEHDGVYKSDEPPQPPDEKPGIVGDWCRAFDVPTAIEKFGLPYEKVK